MANFWMKLYVEILDDPKVGRIPEYLFARMIKLFLVAKETNRDGLLPPVSELAWRLRTDEGSISTTLAALGLIGVVRETTPGIWLVVNFAKRQAAESSAERVKNFRQRERNEALQEAKRGETFSSVSSSSSSSDSLEEGMQGGKPFTAAETASAIASFGNNGARKCEQLYQKVTGQPCIPPNQTDMALKYLQAVIDSGEPDIEQGKQVFAQWCSTQGKNGRSYSKLNTAWLGKWLEQLAPVPEATHGINQQTDLERAMARIHAAAQER